MQDDHSDSECRDSQRRNHGRKRGRSPAREEESPPETEVQATNAKDDGSTNEAEARFRAFETQMREMIARTEETTRVALAQAEQKLEEMKRKLEETTRELEATKRATAQKDAEPERQPKSNTATARATSQKDADAAEPERQPKNNKAKAKARAPAVVSDHFGPSRRKARANIPKEVTVTQEHVTLAKHVIDQAYDALVHKTRDINGEFLTLLEQSAFVEDELKDLANFAGNQQVVLKADPRERKSPAIIAAAVNYLKAGKKMCVVVTGVHKNRIFDPQQAAYETMMKHLGNIHKLFINGQDANNLPQMKAYAEAGVPFIVHICYDAKSIARADRLKINVDDLAFVFDEVQNKISGRVLDAPKREVALLDMGFTRSASCFVSATHGDTMDVLKETENEDNFVVLRACKKKQAMRNFFDVSKKAEFIELPSNAKGDTVYTDVNRHGFEMNTSDDALTAWERIHATLGTVFKNHVLVPGSMTCLFGLRFVEGKGSNLGKIASYIYDLSQTPTDGFEPIPSDKLTIIAHWGSGAHLFKNVPSEIGNISTKDVVFFEKDAKFNVPEMIAHLHIQKKLSPDSTIVVLSNLAYDGSLDYQIAGSFKEMTLKIEEPDIFKEAPTHVKTQVVFAPYKDSLDRHDVVYKFEVMKAVRGLAIKVLDTDAPSTSAAPRASKEIGGRDKYVVFDIRGGVLMAAETADETSDCATLRMEEVVDLDGKISVPDTYIDQIIAYTAKQFNANNIKQGVSRPNGSNRTKPLHVFMSRRAIQSVKGLDGAEDKLFTNPQGVLDVTTCEDAALKAHRGHLKRKHEQVPTVVTEDDYNAKRQRVEKDDDAMEDDAMEDDGGFVAPDGEAEADWTAEELMREIVAVMDAETRVVKRDRLVQEGIIAAGDTNVLPDLVLKGYMTEERDGEEYRVNDALRGPCKGPQPVRRVKLPDDLIAKWAGSPASAPRERKEDLMAFVKTTELYKDMERQGFSLIKSSWVYVIVNDSMPTTKNNAEIVRRGFAENKKMKPFGANKSIAIGDYMTIYVDLRSDEGFAYVMSMRST